MSAGSVADLSAGSVAGLSAGSVAGLSAGIFTRRSFGGMAGLSASSVADSTWGLFLFHRGAMRISPIPYRKPQIVGRISPVVTRP